MNKTVKKIKKIGGSPVFLISVIAFTASTILGFIGSVGAAESLKNAAVSFLTSQDTLSGFADKLNSFWVALPVSTVSASLISIIIAVGMWMHYFSSRSAKNPPSTVGMTIIKVVKVIELVAFILVMLLLVVVFGMAFIAAASIVSGQTGEIPLGYWIVIGIIAAVMLAVTIMTVLYYMGIFKTIKSVRMTLNTGVIMGKVSAYVIVINYFIAAASLTLAVLSPDVIALVGGICYAVSFVMCSVALGTLRSEMQYIASRGSSAIE